MSYITTAVAIFRLGFDCVHWLGVFLAKLVFRQS